MSPSFDSPADFISHAELNHPELMDENGRVCGRKQMNCHMDGAKFYQSDYTWLKDGKPFAAQSVRLARKRNDPMYYEED